MPTCPTCHTEQPDGAVFCDNCGAQLGAAAAAAPLPSPASAAPAAVPTCPNCGAMVLAGQAFCENCGTALGGEVPAALSAVPSPTAVAGAPVSAGAASCPSCGAPLAPDSNFCDNCGAPVGSASTSVAPPVPPIPSVPPTPSAPSYVPPAHVIPPAPAVGYAVAGPVQGRLVVQGTNVTLPFPPGKAEIIVGREDPISNIFPDIDLTNYGADEGGVSRRHAKIFMQGSQVMIEDLNSTNYTFVNQQRLTPGQPHPVQNGDEVRFGRVKLNFYL